jgi:hypothetical protein
VPSYHLRVPVSSDQEIVLEPLAWMHLALREAGWIPENRPWGQIWDWRHPRREDLLICTRREALACGPWDPELVPLTATWSIQSTKARMIPLETLTGAIFTHRPEGWAAEDCRSNDVGLLQHTLRRLAASLGDGPPDAPTDLRSPSRQS